MQELLVHSVRRLTAGPAKRCGRRSRHIWQNTLLFLCARPIVRTMPTTSFAIMASHTTYTSTQQQYIHVHITGRTGRLAALSTFRILPLFSMHAILWGSSFIKRTLAVRRCYVTRMYQVPWRLVFRSGCCLCHRPLPVGLFGDSDG